MARRDLLAVVTFMVVAQLLACGGSSSSSPPLPHTSATVGAATGGTVTLSGGPAVQIPSTALASDTTITIQQLATAPTGAVGAAYDLGPSGTTFSQPVTVTIPVPAGTTDALIWTKPAGADHYTSLPTTIANGVATAQTNHFSVVLVGPVDLNGTWAGGVDYSFTNPNGTSGTGWTMQAREVTQGQPDPGVVTMSLGNSGGVTETCTGTVSGSVLTLSCTRSNLDGTCTAARQEIGQVSGNTWVLANSFTWTGTSCASNGQLIQVLNSPITKKAGPGRNVAGTYTRTSTWTMTGPSKTPVQGSGTGNVTRTQAAGSSMFQGQVSMDNGSTYTCKGVVVDDATYASCYGFNTAHTIRYNTTSQGTITVGPPFDVDSIVTTTIVGDPNGYTFMTSHNHDVKQ